MEEKVFGLPAGLLANSMIVILVAISGVWQRVKKSYFFFRAMKSGRYRPACRIIQTGGRVTVSPLSAFRKRLFFNIVLREIINYCL